MWQLPFYFSINWCYRFLIKVETLDLLCLAYCSSYTFFRVCVRHVVPRKGFPKPGMFTSVTLVPARLAWAAQWAISVCMHLISAFIWYWLLGCHEHCCSGHRCSKVLAITAFGEVVLVCPMMILSLVFWEIVIRALRYYCSLEEVI